MNAQREIQSTSCNDYDGDEEGSGDVDEGAAHGETESSSMMPLIRWQTAAGKCL